MTLVVFITYFENVLLNYSKTISNQFHIFPNPADNFITIEGTKDLKSKIFIYDYNGRLIKSVSNKTVIDIQSLSPGIYIVEIYRLGFDKRIVKKLVKK